MVLFLDQQSIYLKVARTNLYDVNDQFVPISLWTVSGFHDSPSISFHFLFQASHICTSCRSEPRT